MSCVGVGGRLYNGVPVDGGVGGVGGSLFDGVPVGGGVGVSQQDWRT